MTRHIALLRGINLGSNRRVAMPRLREALTERGYGDVQTYVQSGNVVLTSRSGPERVARELEDAIAADLGVETDVVVRTRDELADVVARNPLPDAVTDPKRFQVSFLAGEPDPEFVHEIEATNVAPEQVVVDGREIYAWHRDGIQRSKLARLLADRRLGTTATARNWNTVLKLLEMADG